MHTAARRTRGPRANYEDPGTPKPTAQNDALYWSKAARSSFNTTSGSPPTLRTLSAQDL